MGAHIRVTWYNMTVGRGAILRVEVCHLGQAFAGFGDLSSYSERSTAGWTRPGLGEVGALWV